MKILLYSPFVPLDDKLKAVTLEGVEHIYKTFVTHVAEGRKMTFAQVDSAQGKSMGIRGS
jgi:protease-4